MSHIFILMIKMKYEEHIYKEVLVNLLTMIYQIKKLVGRLQQNVFLVMKKFVTKSLVFRH